MRPVEDYASVVFDCDGVILDSNAIKTNAFRTALEGEDSDLIERFVAYHKTHGGVSRYVKFRHFFENMKSAPDVDAAVERALARYANEVKARLLDCAEIPGLRPILQLLSDRQIPCAVNSGGDQAELREVFAARDLAKFFVSIMGSPATKSENLETLYGTKDLNMPGLFLGDARSDLNAAKAFGLDFVFVSGRSDWVDGEAFCRHKELPIVRDLTGLLGAA